MILNKPKALFSAQNIARRTNELAAQITADFQAVINQSDSRELLVIGVLNGSFIFLADLIRSLDIPLKCDFVGASSYGDAQTSSGLVKLTKDLSIDVTGAHVLLVEDIVDTGITLEFLRSYLEQQKPASLRIATLLSKPSRRKLEVPVDYVGFHIEDLFVVGYGLDSAGLYRNLPYIGVCD